jgi:hypothetical protein
MDPADVEVDRVKLSMLLGKAANAAKSVGSGFATPDPDNLHSRQGKEMYEENKHVVADEVAAQLDGSRPFHTNEHTGVDMLDADKVRFLANLVRFGM